MKSTFQKACLIFALLMVLGAFAGCGATPGGTAAASETTGSGTQTSAATSTPAPTPAGLPMDGIKYSPEVTITTAIFLAPNTKYKNGETYDNNVFTKWLKNKLGINIQYLWTVPSTNDAFFTKLQLILSSNEQMPDFISGLTTPQVQTMIQSGKFREVGSLFDQYASPAWKAAIAEVPQSWLPYMIDGKRYALPGIEHTMLHDDCLWIRQDWLDKLGLKAPVTIDDMEKVMDAFVNDDPDGDKQKDTYGLTGSFGSNLNSWMCVGEIFGAYGAVAQAWERDQNGNIVWGSVRPEIKPALAKFKEWIDKGYLRKEIGLYDESKASELFTSGKAGMAMGPTWLYDWPLSDVEKNVPGAKVWPYPIPAGPDGKIGQKSEGSSWGAMLLSSDMKNPEIFFTYYNYLWDNYADPKDGGEFQYGFADGYDYTMVNGKPSSLDKDIPGGYVDPAGYFLGYVPEIPSQYIKALGNMADGAAPSTYEKKVAQGALPPDYQAAKIVLAQHQYTIDDLYLGAPTDTMKDKWSNLTTMESEEFSKIIYGKVPLDDFDRFVTEWNSSGGDQITKEVRDWYASVGGK